MLFITKKCSNCHKPVPETMTVGSRCPHCGVLFGSEETSYSSSSYSGSADQLSPIMIIGLVYAALSFLVPLVLIFAMDIDRGGYFYLNFICLAAGLGGSAALAWHYGNKLREGDLDWSDNTDPALLFIGGAWFLINLMIVGAITIGSFTGKGFVPEILSLGIAGLIGGGFIGFAVGFVLALPVLLYHHLKD